MGRKGLKGFFGKFLSSEKMCVVKDCLKSSETISDNPPSPRSLREGSLGGQFVAPISARYLVKFWKMGWRKWV